MKRVLSIEAIEEATGAEISFHESFRVEPSQEKSILRAESKKDLEELLTQIKHSLKTEKEIACIDAIISLFERVDDLELLNKRAVFVYLREISGLNSSELSSSLSSIRKIYRKVVGPDKKFDIFNIE